MRAANGFGRRAGIIDQLQIKISGAVLGVRLAGCRAPFRSPVSGFLEGVTSGQRPVKYQSRLKMVCFIRGCASEAVLFGLVCLPNPVGRNHEVWWIQLYRIKLMSGQFDGGYWLAHLSWAWAEERESLVAPNPTPAAAACDSLYSVPRAPFCLGRRAG